MNDPETSLHGEISFLEERLKNAEKKIKELKEALQDIKDHSGTPVFSGVKWSNYCHVVAFEVLDRMKEETSEGK